MDREEILLREYQICQEYINSVGSQVWTSTTIYLTVNVTLLTGIVYGVLTSKVLSSAIALKSTDSLPLQVVLAVGGIIILGGGIIAILCQWMRWLKRMRFLTGLNYQRMNAIERALGMRRHWLVHYFDERYDPKPPAKASNADRISERYKYAPAKGFESLICIAKTLIVLWSIVIVGVAYIIIAVIALTLCRSSLF